MSGIIYIYGLPCPQRGSTRTRWAHRKQHLSAGEGQGHGPPEVLARGHSGWLCGEGVKLAMVQPQQGSMQERRGKRGGQERGGVGRREWRGEEWRWRKEREGKERRGVRRRGEERKAAETGSLCHCHRGSRPDFAPREPPRIHSAFLLRLPGTPGAHLKGNSPPRLSSPKGEFTVSGGVRYKL